MSIGMIALLILGLLILFGVLSRVLDRMALTDRQALLIVSAMFVGGLLPDIPLGLLSINIGGALIPIIVSVYLLLHAGTAKERIRAVVAACLTAAAVFAVSLLVPADPAAMPWLDPMILYGLAGGAISWLLGRSRRSAFIAGVLGVTIADVFTGVSLWLKGIHQTVFLGGAGALDAIVIAGVVGVLCCEITGEAMERMTRKTQRPAKGGQTA